MNKEIDYRKLKELLDKLKCDYDTLELECLLGVIIGSKKINDLNYTKKVLDTTIKNSLRTFYLRMDLIDRIKKTLNIWNWKII